MKKFVCLFIALLFACTSIFMSFAHSGRTDASGGHKDNKNKSGLGSYHYHCGGHPAHLHTNGVCPYTTKSSSSEPSSSSNSTTKSSGNSSNQNTTSSSSSSSKTTTETENQKYVVIVEKTSIYEKASTTSDKLVTAKEGYTFTPTGSTKSFWKMKFKKKDDDTIYVGYILKIDTEAKSK